MRKEIKSLRQVDIIYEDEDIIALNKPSGLLSIPDRYDASRPNLYAMLKARYDNIFTIHRLDFETSGIILFAKNETAFREMNLQFEHRTLSKLYLAIAEGQVQKEEGEIDLSIEEDTKNKGLMKTGFKGKPSLTLYKVLERFRHFTWMVLELKTGRTHQARIHLKAIGHPLSVDKDYGVRSEFYLSSIKPGYKTGKFTEEIPMVNRHTLHAAMLRFMHPRSRQEMELSADLPKDMRVMLEMLRKYDA